MAPDHSSTPPQQLRGTKDTARPTTQANPLLPLLESIEEQLFTNGRVDRFTVDSCILDIDEVRSTLLNQILHHREFQALERSWRSLLDLVERVDFHEKNEVHILNASKEDLQEDHELHTDTEDASLYHLVYTQEYGTHGGRPYGLICCNHAFGPANEDMSLLRFCANIAARAHVPFIANACPSFFGGTSIREVPRLRDMESLFSSPSHQSWREFRSLDVARYVGLCLPGYLLRLPYGEAGTVINRFHFEEDSEGYHERFLWGPASILFASRAADSFARYRWCLNITGPSGGGMVNGLLHHFYETMSRLQPRCPLEIVVTDNRRHELSNLGFISLCYQQRDRTACFFSAPSVQAPKTGGRTLEERATAANHAIASQLPYLFIATRFAHYLKIIQRESLGGYTDPADIERGLNSWLRAYISNMDSPAMAVRARRPLREATVEVADDGEPGWYSCHIQLRPHVKHLGADVRLRLSGTIDK